jgi:hypothetical protein
MLTIFFVLHNPLFVPWHVFYVYINPTMSNKNLANGKYQMWTHYCSNIITKTTTMIPKNLKPGRKREGC